MAARNAAKASRRVASGRPGERSLARPDSSERLFLVAIATSLGSVLQRPVETARHLSTRCTERLGEAAIAPSFGRVGDRYDHALPETVIGLFKTEVIRRRGPWRNREAVAFATLAWVDWFNTGRLPAPVWHIPPAEAERRYHDRSAGAAMAA